MSDGHTHEDNDHLGHGARGAMAGEADWDDWYRSSDAVWSGRPNPHLITETADLRPGTALDVGCGEGADALWLAERGWRVTAVDISGVALERGAARARQIGGGVAERIEWVRADVTAWSPADAVFDLVSAQFMQLPGRQRVALHQRLAALVAAEGTLLVVGHDPSDLQTTAHRPPLPEVFFTALDAGAVLDPRTWDVQVAQTRTRSTTDPDGRSTTVHDAVLKARRRS